MTTFSNMRDLEKYLLKQIDDSMQDVGKMAKQVVKDNVDEVVYSHQPDDYDRTFQLRESISYKVDEIADTVQAEIFSDADQIIPNRNLFQHYSVAPYDPMDYSDYVAQTVEEGSSGKVFGEGFWTEPRPFMQRSAEQMEYNAFHTKTLKNSLKHKRIDVE